MERKTNIYNTAVDTRPEKILRLLDSDVLVRHQTVHSVVLPLPPVVGGSLEQQERGALFERQLPTRAARVVELGDGFDRFRL